MNTTQTPHTPGPWHIDGRKVYRIGVQGEWDAIADVHDHEEEEGQANAAVIASAPELLAFAKAFLAGEQTEQLVRTVKPLIAKAEGRQP